MSALSQLSVRVPEDLRREVKRQAADEGTSVQEFVERALRRALATTSAAPPISERSRAAILAFVRDEYGDLARQVGEDDPDLATM